MIRLSASAIKDYISCPRKYYYRRYFKSLAKPSEALSIGSAVHDSLEKYPNDKENAIKYAKNTAIEYNLSAEATDKVLANVITCFNSFSWMFSQEDIVEKFWEVPFSKGVVVVGKFDRITKHGNLLDWKTGKGITNSKTLTSDPQFILYDWAYRKIYNKEPLSTYYVELVSGRLHKYRRDSNYESLLLDKTIPEMVYKIKQELYSADGRFVYYKYKPCWNCSYSEVCDRELAGGNPLTE